MSQPKPPSVDVPRQPFHAWAPTPPRGWNSWDCFGTAVTEALTLENARYLAAHLLKHGWSLVTVDIQWYEPAAKGHDYRVGAPLAMDGFGRLLPAVEKFPSAAGGAGFKPLADRVHAMGLQFGIHLMRGIPRQAVQANTPVLGTSLRAADVANTADTCPWNPDMFGVDCTKPGGQAYYDSVFDLIASWGVDFVKVDDLTRPYHPQTPEIEAIRRAIDRASAKHGRPIVLSGSPGETPLDAAGHVASHLNLWRISDDFWDRWPLLKSQFERCRKWAPHAGPGHWPDADMLALGSIRTLQHDPWTRFTPDEQLTHLTLWSIARSPLIFGGHLPKNDPWTLSLLSNDEVLDANARGLEPREASNDDGLITWTSRVPDGDDRWVAVFNTRDATDVSERDGLEIPIGFASLGLPPRCEVRDLWSKRTLGVFGPGFTPRIRHHGCGMYRLSPAR